MKLSPATLFKKRIWHRYFPANPAKCLRTPFLTEHLMWLVLWFETKVRFRFCHHLLMKLIRFREGKEKLGAIFLYVHMIENFRDLKKYFSTNKCLWTVISTLENAPKCTFLTKFWHTLKLAKTLLLQCLNPLSTNFTKWSNTLKQFVGNLPTNCLSVFNHFVGLALKGLTTKTLFNVYI